MDYKHERKHVIEVPKQMREPEVYFLDIQLELSYRSI